MSLKNTNLNLVICLLFGVLLCILGCNAIPNIKKVLTPDPNRFPVRSLKITMDLDHREEFFTQLQNFADKHSLELRSTFHDADKKSFIIVLAGDSFHISALSHLYSPSEISVDFYNEASPPTSQATFNELSADLKNFLNKIPNVIIKEKFKRLKIAMDENQMEEVFNKLFTQLREFADQHSLEFMVSSYDADMKIFLVEMEGDGFQITSEALPSPLGEINVDFYIHYDNNGDPTSISQKTVDELFNDLKNYFGKIPNVTITEEK